MADPWLAVKRSCCSSSVPYIGSCMTASYWSGVWAIGLCQACSDHFDIIIASLLGTQYSRLFFLCKPQFQCIWPLQPPYVIFGVVCFSSFFYIFI